MLNDNHRANNNKDHNRDNKDNIRDKRENWVKLDNRENWEKKESKDNIRDRRENLGNKENLENREDCKNREDWKNRESRENWENRDHWDNNRDNRENLKNQENWEKRENKDNNKDLRDNRDNKENIENRDNNLLLKIYFDEKTKRFSLPRDFQELKDVAKKSFSSNNLMEPFDIYYMDEEKDLILIENQLDYENACLFLKHNNSNTLKLSLKSNNNEKYDAKLAIKYLENSINLSKISLSRSQFNKIEEQKDPLKNYACDQCQRKFLEKSSQQKHMRVCSRVFGSKRQPFDSKKQRFNHEQLRDQNLKLNNMSDKLFNQLENLKLAMNKWRKSCKRLQNNLKLKGRPFRDLFVELDAQQCNNCRRKFSEKSFRKHSENCQKLMSKRNPFNSKNQRIVNSEHEILLRKQEEMEKNKKIFLYQEKDDNERHSIRPRWKRLSDRFRVIMRISRLLYNSRF